ncbi:CHAT domain-containing protein [Rhizohabitans arisaemae]|uniref:CHAT domain-containing protein n=1 Tax=Rhizohabitans arisaemae TaxID=2720610 RepID=UPI0024B22BA0|nr:CHAT domain-containing protein [Rhizohabitans arisaemae]
MSRPRDALLRARALLAQRPGPLDASYAHQAAGIVLRDFGDVEAAIRELRTAARLARAADSRDREADVLATLGIALIQAGRTPSGLAVLDRSVGQAGAGLLGRVLMRRGGALWVLGRYRQAQEDLGRAVRALQRDGDTVWLARALMGRALAHLSLGATERADADFRACERLYAETRQELEQAAAIHNRGLAAFRSGDLPTALTRLDDAAPRYQALNAPMADLSIDRCAVYLAAGLSGDALLEASAAVESFDQVRGQATKKAELMLTAAHVALATGDPRSAWERAQAAARLFGAQRRPWWQAQARLVLAEAKYASGQVGARLLHEVGRAAQSLDRLGSGDAARAHLLAGRVALALGRAADADAHLATAARTRGSGAALSRSSGWLAEALRARAARSPRRLLHACRRGLDVLDSHLLTLGATELRAQATAQGAELAALAQRQALETGGPRDLLLWSERWRATALRIPPVRPPDDRELRAELTALRDVTSRLERSGSPVSPRGGALRGGPGTLHREQQRLEAAIRERLLRTRGTGRRDDGVFTVPALLDRLGDARLLEIAEIDGELHVLVCGDGRVRRLSAGRAADAAREIEFARSRLVRLAHNRSADLSVLNATGARLERILLGPAVRELGEGPIVVVPPAKLLSIPWALLPALTGRVFSVAPSATAWLRSRGVPAPVRRDVVLVHGPGLGSGAAEVPKLMAEYGDATSLGDGTATAKAVLEAIDGAWLAHIAAHGTFRSDSPLFSSLRMDDGPLTVHDFELLGRAPYRLVLPSCDSGRLASAGADELLGLTSSLAPLGTAGIVASVVPVNDEASVDLMLALHRGLRTGLGLAESLRDARRELGGFPLGAATAASFLALGAD